MNLNYKNTDLQIYIDNKKYDYDINKDVDIEQLRESFNNSISNLSQKHNSLEYWTMRISERNTLVHNLFLDICKIELINKLSHQSENIEIYTNNISIYIYFKEFISINLKEIIKFRLKKIAYEYKAYLQMFKFVIKKSLFSIRFKDKKFIKDLSNSTIIQTWVSDSNFKNIAFKDSYYSGLSDYLDKNGNKAVTWSVFYNVKNEKKVVEFIRNNSEKFLLIEDYLNIFDYIFAISLFFKKRFLSINNVKIENNNFTAIFKHYQKKEVVEHTSLFYSFTKRLKELKAKNITFVHHHENMIPEKALILGVRKYLQGSKVIGYFHTTKPKNQLCLEYANNDEYKMAPKPDVMIFNSDKYKKYYENKYSNIPMHNGIAFKQLHLRNKADTKHRKNANVLVLFSGTNDEIKLMFDLLNTLEDKYSFIFRMHPMNQFDIKKYYLKDNYKIENDITLDVLLSNVSKVISTYSAVAVETALNGLKVGLVYNKKELLINPFDDTDIDNYQLIGNGEDLQSFLNTKFEQINVEQIFNIKNKYYEIFTNLNKKGCIK